MPDAIRVRALWISLALVVVVVGVFAPVGHFGFVDFDDDSYVYENRVVEAGLSWSGVRWAATASLIANWHPVTWLSHMADVELFGLDPAKHHLTNLVLHGLNTLLLFGWLWRVTRALEPSAFVAALFAVHPLHVEPVVWIAQRKELLCTSFWLLSMWAYVRYVERRRASRYLVLLAVFALGLMTKPTLVTLPFALLLLDFWPLGRALGFALVREKLPLLALTIGSSVVTYLMQRGGGAVAKLVDVPLGLRLCNAVVSYVTYLAKSFWPTQLTVLYPYPRSFPAWQVVGAVALLIAISALALRTARKRPYLLVGWLWFLGTMVPMIGLVQVGNQAMADRYAYVPMIGLFIAVAWGARDLAQRWTHRTQVLWVSSVIVIAACAAVARAQVETWRDDVVLWTRAVDLTVDNALAHNNLGVALAATGRSDEAYPHFVEAVRIEPRFSDAHANLANQLTRQKRYAEASSHYRDAIRTDPDAAMPHFGLAICLVAQGELAEAVREMMSAVRLEPANANYRFNLAVILLGQGKRAAAAQHLEAALALDPDHAGARRELALLRAGKPGG
jgi:tetratricopeptide (TPR) repeat protein